jgi:hypothetical protein
MEACMKRWLTALMVFAMCSAVVRADVTIVQTTTIEGGMAAMGGGAMSPTMTTRVKGMKSRTEVNAANMMIVTITDLAAKQVTILRPDQKTATVVSTTPPAAGTGAPAGTTPPAVTPPNVESSIKPTGKSQVIDGITCDEYAFTTSMDMSEMGGPQTISAEAAAVMKDMKVNMTGSMWVAKDVPGAGEYIAFQKAAASNDMGSVVAGATGMKMPGMEKVMKAMAGLNGMAYLTEMSMTIEGTGQMADMMKQMGAMKITTRVTSVKTDAIADDQFTVPADYKVVKQ